MLLRGEVVWWKGQGSTGGSCAWGTFARPANPVLRDITERVIIAGKGASTEPSPTPTETLSASRPR